MSLERDPHLIAAFADARAEAFMSGCMWLWHSFLNHDENDPNDPGVWMAATEEARHRYRTINYPRERPGVREALIDLITFQPECANPEGGSYGTESFLYENLGKEDARTVLSYLGQIAESIGYAGLHELWREIYHDKQRKE